MKPMKAALLCLPFFTLSYTLSAQQQKTPFLLHNKSIVQLEDPSTDTCKGFWETTIDHELIEASSMGNLDKVKALVQKGADVNFLTNAYACPASTALMAAAQKGYLQITQWLVNAGAELETFDDDNQTALHLAAQAGHLELVQWFIDTQGMSLNHIADNPESSNFGKTPLHAAAQGQAIDVINWLSAQDADITQKTLRDETALSFSLLGYAYLPESTRNKETINYFLAKGLNASNSANVMQYAALSNDLELVQDFVRQGGDIHAENLQGLTPLDFSMFELEKDDEARVAKWLIAQGVDTNRINKDGYTPIYHAMWTGNFPLIQILIEKGAVVDMLPKRASSPLGAAIFMQYWDIAKWVILEKNIDVNQAQVSNNTSLLHGALKTIKVGENPKQITFIQWLVQEKNADIEATDVHGETPLFYAMHTPILRQWLVAQGANIHHENKRQETVLLEAVFRQDLEAIDFFIDKGLDISHRNQNQNTVLHTALWFVFFPFNEPERILALVQKLVEAGAPINARNSFGHSALSMAKSSKLTHVVDYLIAQGAEE